MSGSDPSTATGRANPDILEAEGDTAGALAVLKRATGGSVQPALLTRD